MPSSAFPAQRDTLLQTLMARFKQTMPYHPHSDWQAVQQSLQAAPHALDALQAMENTGGEPNVVEDPAHPDLIVFMDCAAESPVGRRSLCYDQDALLSRKSNPPKGSAVHTASMMGIRLLTEAQYRALQQVGEFDLRTSSWVLTPPEVRTLGGALFCDRRYNQVFTYHNGADAYYGSRGFRGFITLPAAL